MGSLRIATYNIHKGVQGLGLAKRLEIHNLGHAVEQFDADIVCLQEVRSHHRKLEAQLSRWPQMGQADFLAPEGYEVVYRTNAVTRHGEHGNAVLSRWPVAAHQHEDMSDHRLEQRGLLHVEVQCDSRPVHVLVVHLGLIRASRIRQLAQLQRFIRREVPSDAPLVVAGDFNEWGALVHDALNSLGLRHAPATHRQRLATFPSRMPLVQLDHIYVRGLEPLFSVVPRGRIWRQMSDHLPLISEFGWP